MTEQETDMGFLFLELQFGVFGFGCARNKLCFYLVIYLLFPSVIHYVVSSEEGTSWRHTVTNSIIGVSIEYIIIIIPSGTYFGMALFLFPCTALSSPKDTSWLGVAHRALIIMILRFIILVSFL